MYLHKNCLLIALLSSTIFLASCGDKENAEGKAETKNVESQVVAKVNGDEISIHQINFELGRLGQLNEEQSKAASKQILTRLVDQQLLKRQALDAKLDREPRIVQTLEAMKSQLLAQAYLEQKMATASKPSVAEVDAFYKEHPELFESRRVFRLQELSIVTTKEKYAQIEEGIKSLKGINKVAEWLRDNNFPFSANSNVKPAEQLPLELLKKLQPMKDGDFLLVPTDKTFNIVHIAATQLVPIPRDKATPVIEQYFLNQNKSKIAKTEMDSLKAKAKIEYVGAFADMNNAKDATTPEAKSPAVAAPEPQKQPSEAKPAADTSMDKGLSGL